MSAIKAWYIFTELLLGLASGICAVKGEWTVCIMLWILIEVRAHRIDGMKP